MSVDVLEQLLPLVALVQDCSGAETRGMSIIFPIHALIEAPCYLLDKDIKYHFEILSALSENWLSLINNQNNLNFFIIKAIVN